MLSVNKIFIILMIIISIVKAGEDQCTKRYKKPTQQIQKFIQNTIGFDILNNFDKAIPKFQLKSKIKDNFMLACSSSHLYCTNEYFPTKTGVYTYDIRKCCKSITYIKMLDVKYYKQDVLNAIKRQTPSLYYNEFIRYKIKNHFILISRIIFNSIDGSSSSKVNNSSTFISYDFSLEDNDVKECESRERQKKRILEQGKKLQL